MSRSRMNAIATLALVVTSSYGLSGCMFKMRHEMSVNAFFNAEPGGRHGKPFRDEAMKNWALAGLVPYSGFGAKDLVESRPRREISSLSIETVFTGIDTLVWFIPGFVYGYYVWAPRHIKVEGMYVDDAVPVVRPGSRPGPLAGAVGRVTR